MLVLGIGGNDLLAYALVYGFCQDGKSCFKGSYEYIAAWLGCNRCTVIRVVARLEDAGLLRKEDRFVNGVKFCDLYALIPEGVQNATGGGNLRPTQWQNATEGGGKMQHHNNSNIKQEDNREKEIYKERKPSFNFRQSLIDAGVSSDTADQWLEVRKVKRLANTQIALKDTLNEIAKSGASAEQCIRLAVSRSWGGFKAEWLQREQAGGAPSRPRKVDNVTYMVEQHQQWLAEQEAMRQNYNPQDDLPDEQ